jgi:hypothetical protein
MRYPYTSAPLDALVAAQASTAVVLAGVLWHKAMRPRGANGLLLGAMALTVLAPVGSAPFAENGLLHELGTAVGSDFAKPALDVAAALASGAALLTRRRLLAGVALAGEAVMGALTSAIKECDADLAAAHMAFFGLLVGLHLVTAAEAKTDGPAARPTWHAWREEVSAFAAGTIAGALVCRLVERGLTSGADEWANTYEAALFAKLHAYGQAPPCGEDFRSYWVFQHQGRAFAQYTPGWPYFMAPFAAAGAAWLAGPAALGLLAAAIVRLARRCAEPSSARTAGLLAAAATLLGATMLVNGASRYPHVFVAATFAWSLEALCAATEATASARARKAWAVVLGAGAAWLLSTRPLDGATLGLGLAAALAHAVRRRSVEPRLLPWAAIPFASIAGLTIVVLRLQLGRWWTTGYSLTAVTYPWAVFGWSLPHANEWRWGLPLAAGTYCAWPASVALGLAGLALVRGPARGVPLACLVGCGALLVAYTLSEFGRGIDFGYGPRYQLPCIVPMAVGTGVLVARVWESSRVRIAKAIGLLARLASAGPIATCLGAALAGVVLVSPGMYRYTRLDVERHNWLRPTLDASGLHHAVVFATTVAASHALDLCENLPLDLYPDQDVLLAIDRGDESLRCVHEAYPDRALYRASIGPPVRIEPAWAPTLSR